MAINFNIEAFRRCVFVSILLFVLVSFTFFGVYLFPHHHDHQSNNTIQELYYIQTLDHFTSDSTNKEIFQQRYFLDRTHWRENHGPIFVFFGGNDPITPYVNNIAVLNKCVPKFKALVIYIEHRFYGHSVPRGLATSNAISDPTMRGYLTSGQAIADYEEMIVNIKTNLSAAHSPVVLVGSFYGGILATWFMMAKPGIAIGALASSAPMYYFYSDTQQGADDFCSIISKDFQETNPLCHDFISQSWSAIDAIASEPDGLNILSNTFRTCSPVQSAYELKYFLAHFYTFAAQFTSPSDHWVDVVCDMITGSLDRDIVSRISDAVREVTGIGSCRNITGVYLLVTNDVPSTIAWSWQQCNEFIIPSGCNSNSMLPVELFDVSQQLADCDQQYGKTPPSNWIGNQIGGNNLNAALSSISGKIIFSNGMKDPYSSKGVLHDISHTSVAITTEQGTHSLDLMPEEPDDPDWLIRQRKQEIKLITQWIDDYSPN